MITIIEFIIFSLCVCVAITIGFGRVENQWGRLPLQNRCCAPIIFDIKNFNTCSCPQYSKSYKPSAISIDNDKRQWILICRTLQVPLKFNYSRSNPQPHSAFRSNGCSMLCRPGNWGQEHLLEREFKNDFSQPTRAMVPDHTADKNPRMETEGESNHFSDITTEKVMQQERSSSNGDDAIVKNYSPERKKFKTLMHAAKQQSKLYSNLNHENLRTSIHKETI